MKKRIILWLTVALTLVFPLSVYAAGHFPEDLMGDADLREIRWLEDEILVCVQDALETDEEIEIPFERAVKVYKNTGMEGLRTDEEEAVTEFIEKAPYDWVLSYRDETRDQNILVTLVDESGGEYGSWHVTGVSFGEIPDYYQRITDLEEEYDKLLCVGGIPGVRYPLLVGFRDGRARELIGLGYDYDILEDNSEGMNTDPDRQFYDFSTSLERIRNESTANLIHTLDGASDSGGVFVRILLCAGLAALAVLLGVRLLARKK